MSLLSVERLTVGLPPGADRSHAITDVSFGLDPGEVLCIVGESGSGKSVSAAAIMGLLPPALKCESGSILFEGRDLLRLPEPARRAMRGARIGMIFQEPMTALNPLMRVGDQVAEVLAVHGVRGAAARVASLLAAVNLPDPTRLARSYPHHLSGGQRQRIMIAIALALEPALLIADEPTTALDVTTQMQILQLIREIQHRNGTGVLFITHDFGVVAEIADRVAVMQSGRIVEAGPVGEVLNRPQHPYTQSLIAAVPHGRTRAPAGSTLGRAAVEARPSGVAETPGSGMQEAREHVVARAHPNGLEARPAAMPERPILEVIGVRKTYYRGGLFSGRSAVHAVASADFFLRRGETLGLVGESGSGKSTLARCVVRLVQPDDGAIRFHDTNLARLDRRAWKPFRRRIQMVFQDPFASLNPRRRVGQIIAEGPIAHGTSRSEALRRAADLLRLVRLEPSAIDRFPHEFSGGQRQRIGIARALAMDPELLIADEPVSALDVSVQAQVLALLDELRQRLGLTMLFITHDLRVAAQICDRVAVMQDGAIVEQGETSRIFASPAHPYTQRLLAAIPGRGWAPPMPLAAPAAEPAGAAS